MAFIRYLDEFHMVHKCSKSKFYVRNSYTELSQPFIIWHATKSARIEDDFVVFMCAARKYL